MTGGGPGISTEMPAIYVIQHHHSSAQCRAGHGGGHHDAAADRVLLIVRAIVGWRQRRREGLNGMTHRQLAMTGGSGRTASAPGRSGPSRKRIPSARIGIYAFLIIAALFFLLPLYVMLVTSLKDDAGDPRRQHLQPAAATRRSSPGSRPGVHACTGRDCTGLAPGFLNSVKITVPAVIVSIVVASLNGYALSFWHYKGAELLLQPAACSARSCRTRWWSTRSSSALRDAAPVRDAAGHHHRPHRSSACRS